MSAQVAVRPVCSYLLLAATVALAQMPHHACATPVHIAGVPALQELAELTVEQLSQITVMSVARRAQPLSHAATAIFVITDEDIRRSGANSLPEVLRLAPNLQVARADANQYAISARGFNNVLANKLLVMIDGRTVYSPLFSGVFWEAQQVMLEDVQRIEVISGPGTTLWGANAVNGVINVITKRAGETQGGLAAAGVGNREHGSSVRWGARLGDRGHYRIYGTRAKRHDTRFAHGDSVNDASDNGQVGFRADLGGLRHQFTISGDVYRNDIDQSFGGSRDLAGANLLARWQRSLEDGSALRVQVYYDRVERHQPGAIKEKLDTWDVDTQYGFRLAERHQMLLGIGYRHMSDALRNLGPGLAFIPASRKLHRGHVFAQNEIALTSRVDLTLGLKFEHNDYTQWEVLPNARLSWRFASDRMLWSALSRAVRAPSRIDRELFRPAQPPYLIAGGEGFISEVANVLELGYRAQTSPRLSYSLTVFRHEFDRLRTLDPAPGGAQIGNNMEGRLNGIETWGSFRVSQNWRLTGGLTRHWHKLSLPAGRTSLGGTAAAGNDPEYSWQLGSALNLTPQHEFDLRIRRVGALPSGPVPAYTSVDVRLGWQVSRHLELALTLHNLFDPGHPEWGVPVNRAEMARAAFVKLMWRL